MEEVFVVVVLMQEAVSHYQRLASRRPDTPDSPSLDFSPKKSSSPVYSLQAHSTSWRNTSPTMRYILLFYQSQRWLDTPPAEKNRVHEAVGQWMAELTGQGKVVTCAALQPIATATTLRVDGGKIVLTDGPFAETKEVLGGLQVIECADLDEAIAIAKRFPALQAGCTLELRPLNPGTTCRA